MCLWFLFAGLRVQEKLDSAANFSVSVLFVLAFRGSVASGDEIWKNLRTPSYTACICCGWEEHFHSDDGWSIHLVVRCYNAWLFSSMNHITSIWFEILHGIRFGYLLTEAKIWWIYFHCWSWDHSARVVCIEAAEVVYVGAGLKSYAVYVGTGLKSYMPKKLS